jgi:5-methylcytosine-specific restriction endonuclease McrA
MARALLLNSTYEPLLVISWQRAVTMLVVGKVEVVKEYETVLCSVSWKVQMPAVVRLRDYVRRRRRRIALTRRNIFLRDKFRCQYCSKTLRSAELTMDHVVPRSQGGGASWENLVASCGPCNRRKGGRTPRQARMKLLNEPKRPEILPIEHTLNLGNSTPPEHWRDFLGWSTAVAT